MMFCVEVVETVDGTDRRVIFGPFRAEASAADFARHVNGRKSQQRSRVIELEQPVIEVSEMSA